MSNPLQQTIEALAKEKGIEPDVVISAIEEAVATASRKYYKTGENLKTRFNTETGQVDLFALKTVVEEVATPATEIAITEAREMYRPLYGDDVANSIELGDEMEFPKPTEVLGRIAAQTAKQVIFQKVREAERENIFAEYNQRIGDVVNGIVKRFENGDIILEIGRIEAVLPRKEQSRAESYTPADRVRTVIKGVNRSAKGPQIVLSRTDPALLIKLFEQEVPEIYDGTVMIRGAVREAGDRAKVAVFSRERDVDPVGACVGMKGTRVQSIIRELRGEKIDIVEFSDDVSTFVTNSLNPAKINRVQITDPENKTLEVVVDDEQLSLAIGKKGQNVRLASRLAGWKIDIKSEQEKKREVQAEMERMARDAREMASLEGVSEKLVQKLQEGGVQSLDAITDFGIDGLTNVPGVGPKTAEKILAAAQAGLQARAELEEAERIEAERLAAEEAARQAEEQARLAEEAAAEEAARQVAESAAEAPAASAEDDEATEVGAEPSETDEDAAGPAAEEAATPHGETLDSTAGERREGD